jgi:DNA-binding MarR family transcriptional regulator
MRTAEQAARLEQLMPNILRRLFTVGHAGVLADMPMAQLRICSYLQDSPRSMTAIAEELEMSTSAVTQIADRMERAGLVERVAAREDRRLKLLHLTPRATRLMVARRERRTKRAEEALALLPRAVRNDLISGLEQLLQATLKTAQPAEIEPWDRTDVTVNTL